MTRAGSSLSPSTSAKHRKAGPERELFERYLGRANDAGRKLALTFDIREAPESRAGSAASRKDQEASALADLAGRDAVLVALDENGQSLDSPAFAGKLGAWRDSGKELTAFIIGGADGLAPSLVAKASLKLAFGKQTWPHQLVRLMLAEQLYRDVTILSGHPYHRE